MKLSRKNLRELILEAIKDDKSSFSSNERMMRSNIAREPKAYKAYIDQYFQMLLEGEFELFLHGLDESMMTYFFAEDNKKNLIMRSRVIDRLSQFLGEGPEHGAWWAKWHQLPMAMENEELFSNYSLEKFSDLTFKNYEMYRLRHYMKEVMTKLKFEIGNFVDNFIEYQDMGYEYNASLGDWFLEESGAALDNLYDDENFLKFIKFLKAGDVYIAGKKVEIDIVANIVIAMQDNSFLEYFYKEDWENDKLFRSWYSSTVRDIQKSRSSPT